jgi:hypothetical protein
MTEKLMQSVERSRVAHFEQPEVAGQESDKARKERLQMLENGIRAGLVARYKAGLKLKRIRDEKLYEEGGFKTFQQFCRAQFEFSPSEVQKLIRASEFWEAITTG